MRRARLPKGPVILAMMAATFAVVVLVAVWWLSTAPPGIVAPAHAATPKKAAAAKTPAGESAGASLRPPFRGLSCDATGAIIYGGSGDSETVLCPAGCGRAPAHGTGIFPDSSSVCTAAIHAGVTTTSGGPVTVFIAPGQEAYVGSSRHGITTRKHAGAPRSFVLGKMGARTDPVPTGCAQVATHLDGPAGTRHTVSCPPGCTAGSVWGTTTYTADSAICTAAIHAGYLYPDSPGKVKIIIKKGMSRYTGSTRNGVTTTDWDAYERSFSFYR